MLFRLSIRELWLVCILSIFLIAYRLISLHDFRAGIRSVWSIPSSTIVDGKQRTNASFEENYLEWGRKPVPETKILAHLTGMTMFDNLYILNGTYFIVSDDPDSIPPLKMLISFGLPGSIDPEIVKANFPTDDLIRVISATEAARLFGTGASRFDGVTFMQTDPPQFLSHFYHFVIEIVAQLHWRVYSSLDPHITSSGSTKLPFPRRYFFPNTDSAGLRDRAGLNMFFLHAAFPGLSIHFRSEFEELAALQRPFVFERIVLGDRAAWHRSPNIKDPNYVYPLPISDHWWAPVRQSIVEYSAGSRNITWGEERPLILYISRQKTGRRLLEKDHEGLVRELKNLEVKHGYEFVEAYMEDIPKVDQVYLCSRATILLGVHGNGLSNAAYMKPNPRSAVIEILFPPGFAWDYHYGAWAFGIRHIGIWKDKYFTAPETPELAFPVGFHSPTYPVDGKVVAQLIHQRLSMEVDLDDADSD